MDTRLECRQGREGRTRHRQKGRAAEFLPYLFSRKKIEITGIGPEEKKKRVMGCFMKNFEFVNIGSADQFSICGPEHKERAPSRSRRLIG